MPQFLSSLTSYLNPLLVIITGVYAYLTWRMVREMRTARENQTDANLIATPVSADHIYAEIQLTNAGPGPALNVELSISLDPPLQSVAKTWRHPALLVCQTEKFFLPMENPSNLDSLRELAEKHNSLIVKINWENIFGHHKSFSASYKLRELVDGWYNAGRLIPPNDIPTLMQEALKTLDDIHKDLENISQDIKR
jgi:hypothetical protein